MHHTQKKKRKKISPPVNRKMHAHKHRQLSARTNLKKKKIGSKINAKTPKQQKHKSKKSVLFLFSVLISFYPHTRIHSFFLSLFSISFASSRVCYSFAVVSLFFSLSFRSFFASATCYSPKKKHKKFYTTTLNICARRPLHRLINFIQVDRQ